MKWGQVTHGKNIVVLDWHNNLGVDHEKYDNFSKCHKQKWLNGCIWDMIKTN